jgi:hypothetical protein
MTTRPLFLHEVIDIVGQNQHGGLHGAHGTPERDR